MAKPSVDTYDKMIKFDSFQNNLLKIIFQLLRTKSK